MKILFFCSNLQPGRDGEDDYTRLLTKPGIWKQLLQQTGQHLNQLKVATITTRYLQVFKRAIYKAQPSC